MNSSKIEKQNDNFHDLTPEEIRVVNEEIRAIHEEIRVVNEEIRAMHEEIRVVNEEIRAMHEELCEAYDKLIALEIDPDRIEVLKKNKWFMSEDFK